MESSRYRGGKCYILSWLIPGRYVRYPSPKSLPLVDYLLTLAEYNNVPLSPLCKAAHTHGRTKLARRASQDFIFQFPRPRPELVRRLYVQAIPAGAPRPC
ncbi:hypothetical protein EVAR_61594_1 [Eumeta japonica]|uniref:Uncharacterized protein n=1 Tax=Eumeta variegata TaxID=151549 RepID=A0A4C1YL59_EUMVA|nr:hypothetical protein EVAR_61594_1 [Eumeta japonica]